MTPSPEPTAEATEGTLARFTGVFRYAVRAVVLVWSTNRGLTVLIAALTLCAGLLPGAVAYVGKLIVDAVVAGASSGLDEDRWRALTYVAIEGGLVAGLTGAQRGLSAARGASLD